jgi:hypothetical protein
MHPKQPKTTTTKYVSDCFPHEIQGLQRALLRRLREVLR